MMIMKLVLLTQAVLNLVFFIGIYQLDKDNSKNRSAIHSLTELWLDLKQKVDRGDK